MDGEDGNKANLRLSLIDLKMSLVEVELGKNIMPEVCLRSLSPFFQWLVLVRVKGGFSPTKRLVNRVEF